MGEPKIRYYVAASIDGFVAPQDGSVAWLEPFMAVAMRDYDAFIAGIGGVVLGRATYDQLPELGGWYGDLPGAVVTSRPLGHRYPGVEPVHDAARAIRSLRGRMTSGDIWLVGGGRTAAGFLATGLIDAIELTTIPVVLGAGRPLFGGSDHQARFDLESRSETGEGTTFAIYRKR